MDHPTYKSSHLTRIHPYPFTPAFEAVRSALWSATRPAGGVQRQRAHVLEIMGAAQVYVLHRLGGDNGPGVLDNFLAATGNATHALHWADARQQRPVASGTENTARTQQREQDPGTDFSVRQEACKPSELEQAVRRLHPAGEHEAPVFRFVHAVVVASARYFQAAECASICGRGGHAALYSPGPAQLALEADGHSRGVRQAVERFANELDHHIVATRWAFEKYVECKVEEGTLGHNL